MKIKRKKQLNLPQLIEYAWDNNIRNKTYRSSESAEIEFREGDVVRVYLIESDDLFTVEVEEEITEDTKLDLIERFIGGMDSVCYTSDGNTTIKECLKRSPSDCTTTHFYIENDNRELVLIWRDGKLI